MQNIIEQEMEGIVSVILSDYKKERTIDQLDLYNQPQKDSIIDIIEKLLRIVYSGYFRDRSYKFYNVENGFAVQIEDAMFCLNKQIDRVLRYKPEYKEAPEEEVTEEA